MKQLASNYPKLFNVVGELKDFELKLHIDTCVPPVAQPPQRIPFHVRKQVSQELKRLENDGIIEDVKGPTPWISPLVVVPKPNGNARLCVDMRNTVEAILREMHLNLTVDDVMHALTSATLFSKLDLRSRYHQIVLHDDSRYITPFSSHKGVKQLRRFSFGTNTTLEIFQHVLSTRLQGLLFFLVRTVRERPIEPITKP